LVTSFYALVIAVLLVPGGYLISGGSPDSLRDIYEEWMVWVAIGMVVIGQALLLFLSVDTTRKKLTPRAKLLLSYSVTALFLGLLTFAIVWSLGAGLIGDKLFASPFEEMLDSRAKVLLWWLGLWAIWGAIFYLFSKQAVKPITALVGWLLKGSVLELLIAVPCHVVTRQREDCSAPFVTGFGISAGIAIMLLSFGPSVLLLYKKRMAATTNRSRRG
jgi:hypothetical protein